MRYRTPGRLVGPALLLAIACPGPLLSQSAADSAAPLTLAEALAEARQANAQLPVSKLEFQGARARAEQARGNLYPTLSVDGDVHGGTPSAYASGDAFLRVLARAPLYQGGELRAARDASDAEAQAFQAGYRVAVRDLDYAVRTGYARVLRAQDGLAFERRAIERLRTYLSVIQGRQASGQGVGADLLRTQQRISATEADVASLTRELHSGTMALNDVLGRDPDAPLRLAALPEPTAPASTSGEPWTAVPDLAQSQSEVQAAKAGVRAARAGRKLHVGLEADAGVQPVLNNTDAPLNNGTGWGGELTVSFSLPFWDNGIYRGRLGEAGAALDEAQQRDVVMQRAARLAWTRAESALADLYAEYEARTRAADVARDAYLQSESIYRGGQGTSLEVLDSYDAWIQADQLRLDAAYGYRVTEAELYRWGNS